MKATIGEALGLTGSSDEEDLLQRRIDALNSRMMTLVSENVKNGGSFDACEDQFRDLNEQISQLKGRIEAIRKGKIADNEYKKKLEKIDSVIDNRKAHQMEYDDSIVRQMIECIKVFPEGRLQVFFGGGIMIEEKLR
jgi:predicted nuclease with TOPRIM domain